MPHHSEGSERGQVLLGLISVELIIITNFYKLGFPSNLCEYFVSIHTKETRQGMAWPDGWMVGMAT